MDHVLIATVSGLGAVALGLDGAPRSTVGPEIAGLLERGSVLAECLSSSPHTAAAHATILTGRWPTRHRVVGILPGHARGQTLFTLARRAGHVTLFRTEAPFTLPADKRPTRGPQFVARSDEDVLRELAKRRGARTLAVVHFGDLLPAIGDSDAAAGRPLPERPARAISPADTDAGPLEERARRVLRDRVGPFINAALETLGPRPTVVLLVGDRARPDLERTDRALDHAALRVPAVLIAPDLPPGVVRSSVRTVDLAPTLVELLGWPSMWSADMDGSSLARLIRGAEASERPAFARAYDVDADRWIAHAQGRAPPPRQRVVLECVHHGGDRLVRSPRTPDKGTHQRRAPGTGDWGPVDDPATRARLRRDLDAYAAADRGRSVTSDLRADLMDIQYNLL